MLGEPKNGRDYDSRPFGKNPWIRINKEYIKEHIFSEVLIQRS